jgi:hypothetical protein
MSGATATSFWLQGGGGTVHAVATTGEVDGGMAVDGAERDGGMT